MPKRATVKPNVDAILKMVASNSWSAASFSKMVGKHKRWLSEVKRGNNLPSPEEAARMCVLLQTTPEEILVEQADIDLVNALLESEMEKEKAPTETSEREFVPSYEDWEKQAERWTLDQLDNAIWKLFQIKRKREGKHGE